MTSGRFINSDLKRQIEENEKYWEDKPKMTEEQLKAVDEFARKKGELFDKIFDSPEKVEKARAIYKKALGK